MKRKGRELATQPANFSNLRTKVRKPNPDLRTINPFMTVRANSLVFDWHQSPSVAPFDVPTVRGYIEDVAVKYKVPQIATTFVHGVSLYLLFRLRGNLYWHLLYQELYTDRCTPNSAARARLVLVRAMLMLSGNSWTNYPNIRRPRCDGNEACCIRHGNLGVASALPRVSANIQFLVHFRHAALTPISLNPKL